MKEKIEEIITSNKLDTFKKVDQLSALFDAEKKRYALAMCKQTVNNIDRSTEWLDTEEQYEQFIPAELQEEAK